MMSSSRASLLVLALSLALLASGCAARRLPDMEVTAYCGCGQCSGWERGSWRYLKLDFWNRYVSAGRRRGRPYTGQTASGTYPREPHPGLFSCSTLTQPWKLPFRLLFPWLWLPHDGTIAADTRHYPFGTRLHVPGWGNGTVEDRGSAIRGARRLDIYFDDHGDALDWGRRSVDVEILD